MVTTRRLLVLLIAAALVCALASPDSAGDFTAILTPLCFAGMVLITLSRRRVFDTCRLPAGAFALPPASRAPPLG